MLYSELTCLTKPTFTETAFSLLEQCKLHIFNLIAEYLTEFVNTKVYLSGFGENMVEVDIKNKSV
jgi:hypothetical protein